MTLQKSSKILKSFILILSLLGGVGLLHCGGGGGLSGGGEEGGGAESGGGNFDAGFPVDIPVTIAKNIDGIDPSSLTLSDVDGSISVQKNESIKYADSDPVVELSGRMLNDNAAGATTISVYVDGALATTVVITDAAFSLEVPEAQVGLDLVMVADLPGGNVTYPVVAKVTENSFEGNVNGFALEVEITYETTIQNAAQAATNPNGTVAFLATSSSSSSSINSTIKSATSGTKFLAKTTIDGGAPETLSEEINSDIELLNYLGTTLFLVDSSDQSLKTVDSDGNVAILLTGSSSLSAPVSSLKAITSSATLDRSYCLDATINVGVANTTDGFVQFDASGNVVTLNVNSNITCTSTGMSCDIAKVVSNDFMVSDDDADYKVVMANHCSESGGFYLLWEATLDPSPSGASTSVTANPILATTQEISSVIYQGGVASYALTESDGDKVYYQSPFVDQSIFSRPMVEVSGDPVLTIDNQLFIDETSIGFATAFYTAIELDVDQNDPTTITDNVILILKETAMQSSQHVGGIIGTGTNPSFMDVSTVSYFCADQTGTYQVCETDLSAFDFATDLAIDISLFGMATEEPVAFTDVNTQASTSYQYGDTVPLGGGNSNDLFLVGLGCEDYTYCTVNTSTYAYNITAWNLDDGSISYERICEAAIELGSTSNINDARVYCTRAQVRSWFQESQLSGSMNVRVRFEVVERATAETLNVTDSPTFVFTYNP